jgi:hypothetical protein
MRLVILKPVINYAKNYDKSNLGGGDDTNYYRD